MKIQCLVNTVNRAHNDFNFRNNGKYLKSTLALGKEPKKEKDYFLIHFSTMNKLGKKYKIKNLKKVFAKCLSEGKVTISFESPPHDLLIKCEIIQLKCFMQLIKNCITGDINMDQISKFANISVMSKDSAPTKLVILDRSEYPSKGLPRTLETLYINGIKLCNFRQEILLLRNLVILDLSNNEIESLPYELGMLFLILI